MRHFPKVLLLRLLTWHPRWSAFVRAVPRVAVAVSTILMLLVFWFYIFAAWGSVWFGGLLHVGNPDLQGSMYDAGAYYALNFNDFANCMRVCMGVRASSSDAVVLSRRELRTHDLLLWNASTRHALLVL